MMECVCLCVLFNNDSCVISFRSVLPPLCFCFSVCLFQPVIGQKADSVSCVEVVEGGTFCSLGGWRWPISAVVVHGSRQNMAKQKELVDYSGRSKLSQLVA